MRHLRVAEDAEAVFAVEQGVVDLADVGVAQLVDVDGLVERSVLMGNGKQTEGSAGVSVLRHDGRHAGQYAHQGRRSNSTLRLPPPACRWQTATVPQRSCSARGRANWPFLQPKRGDSAEGRKGQEPKARPTGTAPLTLDLPLMQIAITRGGPHRVALLRLPARDL